MNDMQHGNTEARGFRQASPQDWPGVCELLEAAGLPTEDLDADRLEAFLIAETDNAGEASMLGLVGLECFGPTGLLRSLVVREHARGSGLGRRMVQSVEQKARDSGVNALWLLTIDASGFFESLNFRVAERSTAPDVIQTTREFSELCPDDAVLMLKPL